MIVLLVLITFAVFVTADYVAQRRAARTKRQVPTILDIKNHDLEEAHHETPAHAKA